MDDFRILVSESEVVPMVPSQSFRLVVFALLLVPSLAFAQAVPRYDAEGYCDQVADTVGGSYQIRNSCLQQEQSAYNGLKRTWSSISGRTSGYCDEVARSIGGSYVILETCIQQEQGAASSSPGFKY
ncbi:hypothetical protein [Salipiger mucosus]